jgi:hypothetical protein
LTINEYLNSSRYFNGHILDPFSDNVIWINMAGDRIAWSFEDIDDEDLEKIGDPKKAWRKHARCVWVGWRCGLTENQINFADLPDPKMLEPIKRQIFRVLERLVEHDWRI